ncbi:MAG: TRAP transporter fused permease subunit [Deltaproteobacteria bacterium]|nr:TRAP transporter fused permease subunit [Deltaproteobacteria bacterium]
MNAEVPEGKNQELLGIIWDRAKKSASTLIYLALCVYVVYNFFSPLPPHQARALFLLLVFLGLALRPAPQGSKSYPLMDIILASVSVIVFGYIVIYHYQISERAGMPTRWDLIMGTAAVVTAIEGTRRGMGRGLAIVVCIFLAYFIFGQFLPVQFGGHVAYNFQEIVNALYLTTSLDGIFGISTYVFFRYIFLFFLYGNLLMMTNATAFIMDFIRAIVGTRRGGAAMASVTGSGALGSISGMAMGNVMITGVVTIPLMKKTGFKPQVAAGVEAAASSGGQIMPPVMGTVSFLMMAFLAVPYVEIIKAAIVPALLFYLAILASVYFYSVRTGAKGVDRSQVPRLGEVIRRREGFTFVGSFLVLLLLLVMKFSPMYAVMYAIATAFVISFLTPSRLNLRRIVGVIHETGVGFVGLGAAGAGIGIVIGTTLQTGFAFRITGLLLEWTGGDPIQTLIAVFIASFLLGMGLPPIIVYIVAILLAAPALQQLGISPMAAHLFCFYAAICCELSPPIATAAYVASMVAETSFWGTCLYSMMFGAAAHILPFSFALDSSMLLMGRPTEILRSITTAGVGVVLMSWGIAGPFKSKLDTWSRMLVLSGGLLLIFPGTRNAIIGMALALFGALVALLEKKALARRGK